MSVVNNKWHSWLVCVKESLHFKSIREKGSGLKVHSRIHIMDKKSIRERIHYLLREYTMNKQSC